LKRITRQWIDSGYLRCTGGTYPAQVIYQEIADMAAERIKAAINLSLVGDNPVKAILDAYNPTSSTAYVNFTTSKETRWQTDPRRCHINWVVCDSDWEAEFCRVAEAHPRVLSYVKNQNLGLEVPYLNGSSARRYLPDFVVQVNDGQVEPLNLIVANTMHAYWVPGVNNLGRFGRWAFAEFTSVYEIEADFNKLVAKFCALEAV
jgi:type III restriction enzyme